MTQRTFPVLLAALTMGTTALTACAPPARPAPPAPPNAVAPAAVTPAAPPIEAPSLGGLLARERGARPMAMPAVEQVASAIQSSGVTLPPLKQVLARTIGARYCAAGTTAIGLAVAVCEFGSADEAERGLAFSHGTFDRLIPGRSLTRNRTTVLTLTPASSTSDVHAQSKRVAAAFATL